MRRDAREPEVAASARSAPFWSEVLRALREARGATQAGWAAQVGVSRKTVQRWEGGEAVPDPFAEGSLTEICRQRGLFRAYDQGPLRGITFTAELLRDLLAEARLGGAGVPAPTGLPPTAPARLVLRDGSGRTTAYPLEAAGLTIGRGTDNAVVVPSEHVSRYHARVVWDGQGYVLEELGSKNGTKVGGKPVTAPHRLRHGDVVQLASLAEPSLTFEAEDETVTVGHAALPAGGLWIDLSAGEAWLRGRKLQLPLPAFRVLEQLYQRVGEHLSTEALAAVAWPELPGPARSAQVYEVIGDLRRLIEPKPESPRFLLDVPGGVQLVMD